MKAATRQAAQTSSGVDSPARRKSTHLRRFLSETSLTRCSSILPIRKDKLLHTNLGSESDLIPPTFGTHEPSWESKNREEWWGKCSRFQSSKRRREKC